MVLKRQFPQSPGATPLDDLDVEGLFPISVRTKEHLDQWEEDNIIRGRTWALSNLHEEIISVPFLKKLHYTMFDLTWDWAGDFRKRDTNIGIDWPQIPMAMRNMCEDVQYWLDNTTYSSDELCARFHYRLVHIHPFRNGNGRHARLAADLLLLKSGQSIGTWGSVKLNNPGMARSAYIDSLKMADLGDMEPLVKFMRS